MNNKYYKSPYKLDDYCIYILSEDNHPAFNALSNDREFYQKIVDKLNGNEEIKFEDKFTISGNFIYYSDVKILFLRGWGMLIGYGGYSLPEEEARTVQDMFMIDVIETLNK